jgi:ketosteroid isomerase-like protein
MPDGRTYRGHEGARQWLANVRSVLGQMRFEPRRFREMGDTVLVEVAASGTGAGSGVPIAWTVFILFGFRSKKIATSRTLLNEQDAFDAAELPQEARCPSGARSSPGRCRRAAP